jgi:ribose 5-phosphate isomerase B
VATIVFASDHAGFALKNHLVAYTKTLGHEVVDVGTHSEASCDYPDFAHAAAAKILADRTLGILVCGSGIGISIAANRHAGIRAVVCSEPFSAEMARRHNDANVLCMGSRVVGIGLAEKLVDAFLGASFEGGRHAGRVAKIEC